MAKCSCCGVVDTNLYVNGVPVCVDCDHKFTSPSTPVPRITEPKYQPPPKPPRKVQSIDRLTIHIVEAKQH
jgi:hypothetical protein